MARGQTFQLGQFFGAFDRRHEVDGFVLADIRPDVADRDVPRHTHEHGHFVLVTGAAPSADPISTRSNLIQPDPT